MIYYKNKIKNLVKLFFLGTFTRRHRCQSVFNNCMQIIMVKPDLAVLGNLDVSVSCLLSHTKS